MSAISALGGNNSGGGRVNPLDQPAARPAGIPASGATSSSGGRVNPLDQPAVRAIDGPQASSITADNSSRPAMAQNSSAPGSAGSTAANSHSARGVGGPFNTNEQGNYYTDSK
jgi:hypothetical protein